MNTRAAMPDFRFRSIFAALDKGVRKLISNSEQAGGRADQNDSNGQPTQKRVVTGIVALLLVVAGIAVSSHNIASTRLVYLVNGSGESLRMNTPDREMLVA